ncbi:MULTISPECIES: hypothetical protein [unclassified Kribbella]|uniref:hypothetical protein n=1 Tax=unclassified Kribbella TaxID=2644121 RepID=UPI00301782D2
MKVLAWLAFPLVATLLAMCWAAWRGRSRGPRRSGGAFASVEDFRRFNEALAAPGPRATPKRRRGLRRRTPKNPAVDSPTPRSESAANPTPPDPQGSTRTSSAAKFRATGTASGAGRTGFGGSGTVGVAGALESAGALAVTRKLGSAETFGSTNIAGQGS